MFFDSEKVVVNSPRFTTHSTTNSPRITTKFHHEILKTPCKIDRRHTRKKFAKTQGFGRVTQSSGCRIGNVR
jgi:hypothetical protein